MRRGLRSQRRLVAALALVVAMCGGAASAQAQPPTPTPPAAQKEAEAHYQKARELYSTGAYREALSELEAAHALDPNAKELVFNLGVVNEKLGKIDDALRYFREYAQWEGLTAQEKQKADNFIRRLEGAKREIPPTPPREKPEKPPEAERGRIDAATVVAASFAVAGLGVGAIFGVKALTDKPKSNYVTGKDGTIDDLQSATDKAHTEGRVADIGFAVGVVATLVTAYLYFGRTKIPAATSSRAQVSAAPLPGGGALVVQGSF